MPLSRDALRLVLIAGVSPGRPLSVDTVAAAIRGGTTSVQLRAKGLTDREILTLGREMLSVCRETGVPLILNDRPDLALAVGADGVHVGPDDLPPAAARAVIGPQLGLGVSARTLDRVRLAEEAGADYLGVGAVRGTSSKPAATVLGFEGIAEIIAGTTIPVVAIGGVRPGDVPRLREAGVTGVAVMSGVLDAADPEAAARSHITG